jgi:4-hydroxybutyrate CoA-transferase
VPQTIEASEAAALLKPGMTVFVQGAASEPSQILGAIADAPGAAAGVHFVYVFLAGINRFDPTTLDEQAGATCFFVGAQNRASVAAGKTRFLALHYSRIFTYLRDEAPIDLALVQVAPPARDGRCSLGVSVDFAPVAMAKADCVLAEINTSMPAPPGSPSIAYEDLDYCVETDHPLVTYEETPVPDEMMEIGRHVASLIEDGDCIETGIGRVPSAVLAALGGKRDLGIHSGMVSAPIIELMEKGVVTGAMKSIDRGKAVTGVALGDSRLFDYLGAAPDVLFRTVDYTHDAATIARNAETQDGRLTGGTGGLMDFMRGARLSRGGRSILALRASGAGGGVSRIVPALGAGQMVTGARTDVDFVVTEHGIADVRYLSVEERAQALIGIAGADFREDLSRAWHQLHATHMGTTEQKGG